MTDVEQMLIQDEAERLKPYVDTKGKVTIGIGHNLTDKGITTLQSRMIFLEDLADAIEDVRHCCSVYDELSRPRQLVMINMAFNLGRERLGKFVHFLNAIHLEDWNKAADEILDSDAARDLPQRYTRLAQMMRKDVSLWV